MRPQQTPLPSLAVPQLHDDGVRRLGGVDRQDQTVRRGPPGPEALHGRGAGRVRQSEAPPMVALVVEHRQARARGEPRDDRIPRPRLDVPQTGELPGSFPLAAPGADVPARFVEDPQLVGSAVCDDDASVVQPRGAVGRRRACRDRRPPRRRSRGRGSWPTRQGRRRSAGGSELSAIRTPALSRNTVTMELPPVGGARSQARAARAGNRSAASRRMNPILRRVRCRAGGTGGMT